jgi:hypothetical protein
MTTSVINSRLTYNFDTTKFGNSINLSANTQNTLNNSPLTLKTWQKEAIANGPIHTSDYFRDPTINVVASLQTQVNSMKSVINSVEYWDNNSVVGQNANALYNNFSANTITYFKKHTSNISGVTSSNSANSPGTPDYDKIISVGQTILIITNKTDNVSNALPVLAMMTSLFVNTEISLNTAIIAADIITLQNSLRNETDPEHGYTNVYSNLSSAGVDLIYDHGLTANNLLWDRRSHDVKYYQDSSNVINDFSTVTRLNAVGNTQTYLINNYIGTDLYKEKLVSD